MKKALITGITGQDGSYLAELLVDEGYAVVGTTTGGSALDNLVSVREKIEIVEGDIGERTFVEELLTHHMPDEVYNLASVATVARPWDDIDTITRVTALAPLHFLESIRVLAPTTRFFQASSAEMFGTVSGPQHEGSALVPKNPYGIAKIFAHQMVQAYRRDQGIFAVSGILFNHESPRRKEDFVVRKICVSLARIKLGLQESLALGDIESKRDWGYAPDFVRAMHATLQADRADDYVIASGEIHAVREIVEIACRELGMSLIWQGSGLEERGVSGEKTIITIDTALYRPNSVAGPHGDIAKISQEVGWKPTHSFEELVKLMARADYESAQKMK